MEISDVVEFQTRRRITALAKLCLEFLENNRDSMLKYEKLLESAGFEDKELFKANENFILFRKKILDCKCEAERELAEFLKNFEIGLKK